MSRPHTHAGTRGLTNGPHQSNRTGQTSPELVKAVHQLVSVAVGYLNSHLQCSCEEALSQLPITDEHFHWSVHAATVTMLLGGVENAPLYCGYEWCDFPLPLPPSLPFPLPPPSSPLPLSYDLVRHVQDVLSSQLSPLLTRRLGSVCLEGDGHTSAAHLTEEILSSPQ